MGAEPSAEPLGDEARPIYVSTARSGFAASMRDLWDQREVVRAFTVRNLHVRYRQAALGALWAVAQPLALLVPFVVFLRNASARAPGSSYAAATLAALIGWTFLSGAVTNGASALVAESVLVRKTWFAREAPVVAAIAAAGVDLALGLAVYAVVGPMLGAHFGWSLAWLPVVVVALAFIATAIAVPLASLNALYRDVRHALSFVVLLWLFVTPVAYSIERMGASRRLVFAFANPAVGPIDALRRIVAEGRAPRLDLLAASMATSIVVGWFGHRSFRRLAPLLPDVI